MYFNPRSREGSDLIDINPQRTRHYFNPRSREGSDVYTYLPIMVLRIFQSTLPRGERLSIFESSNTSRIISIHAPARGATYFPTCHFFDNSISIHAPARGATNIRFTSASLNSISIHAPARGATCCLVAMKITLQFQSTLPRGERPRRAHEISVLSSFQSTLPRGERRVFFKVRFFLNHFNPRSREGSDSGMASWN